MRLKKRTYWKHYAVKGNNDYNLNKAKGISGELNKFGGYDPTPAWAKVRVKNCPKNNYSTRSPYEYNNNNNNNNNNNSKHNRQ